ncbi:MAG: hypothetical protein C0404_01375 [Verrucomicrobia bacterium]|nr:hypothetical protein [Verrucomicrobiota bacterium]
MGRTFAVLLAFWSVSIACLADVTATNSQVVIDYFYQPGCSECFLVDLQVKPVLKDRYDGLYVLRNWDLTVSSNYTRLLSYMTLLGRKDNERVYMVVGGREMFAGFGAMQTGLWASVEQAISEGLTAEAAAPREMSEADRREMLERRVAGMSVAGMAVAGLADGINPCAFSTMIFLVSVLGLSKAKGSAIWAVGAAFVAATFVTYTAIGLGLLRVLHAMEGFRTLQNVVDFVLIGLLLVLAFLSFRDAVRYRASGDASEVTLRLPERLKRVVNRILMTGLGRGAQVGTAFAVGALVTGIESVCTGQLYVPALAFVVRTGADTSRGIGLLLLYNVMFVVPLTVVLVVARHGIRLAELTRLGARGVVVGKVALGAVFLMLAAGMAALRWGGIGHGI